MIDVVIIANGKDDLLRTISSVFYQVQVLESKIIIYMEKEFDRNEFSSFPVYFYSNWKDVIRELKSEKEGYVYFLNEGDALSNPFVFDSFLKRFTDASEGAVFGSYILDNGEISFEDIQNDVFHFYGKMYRKDIFLKYYPKDYSMSNFFYLNQLLLYKNKVLWDIEFRNYIVCFNHFSDQKLWERELYSDSSIEVVSRLKNKFSKASYDLVISTLLTSYVHYLKGEEILQKELLSSLVPDEISYSEENFSIVKDNDVLVYILQNDLSFIDYLKALKEGRL